MLFYIVMSTNFKYLVCLSVHICGVYVALHVLHKMKAHIKGYIHLWVC